MALWKLLLSISLSLGNTLPNWHYSRPSENELAQQLPIPIRIDKIISPTIGFPSLVRKGQPFSVILQLDSGSKLASYLEEEKEVKVEARIASHLPSPKRSVPKGFEEVYSGYEEYENHQTNSGNEYFSLPRHFFDVPQPTYTLAIEAVQNRDHFLVLSLRMPEVIESQAGLAYDLEVKIWRGEELLLHDLSRHSVGLLRDQKKYRFVHFADPQLNDVEYQLMGKPPKHLDDLAVQKHALTQAMKELNFIQPDFGLISGDLVSGSNRWYSNTIALLADRLYPPEERKLEDSSYAFEYQSIYSFLRSLRFPAFAALGNHDGFSAYSDLNKKGKPIKGSNTLVGAEKDSSQSVLYDGKHFWRRMIGPRYYSFEIGKWHFTVLDTYDLRRFFRQGYASIAANHGGWISKEQLNWVRADFESAKQSGKKIILVGHHDPRGGAEGMFYGKPQYSHPRRAIRQLQEELHYQYSRYRKDRLNASHEWASVHVAVSPDQRSSIQVDPNYHSDKELLRLMSEYPVTHYLLGHDHADFTDQVVLGGRSVEFVHTTTLTAKAYEARSQENYSAKPGEGEGYRPRWGYRLFELAPEGELHELGRSEESNDQPSLSLGSIRLQWGYDSKYPFKESGILSDNRSLPEWLPYISFLKTLRKNRLISRKYNWKDPILLLGALFHPEFQGWAQRLYQTEFKDWRSFEKSSVEWVLEHVFDDVRESWGEESHPSKAWISSQLPFALEGTWSNYLDTTETDGELVSTVQVLSEETCCLLTEVEQFELRGVKEYPTRKGKLLQIPVKLSSSKQRIFYEFQLKY